MKIALIESFFGGSHKAWALGVQRIPELDVELFTLSPRHWKWRMHGGAISLAKRFNESDFEADLILASDMIDLSTFLALTRRKSQNTPSAIYFHENQFAYPSNISTTKAERQRDLHYSFINYISALSADKVFFNSKYNRDSFFEGLKRSLKHYPDKRNMSSIDEIAAKTSVLPLGIDLRPFDAFERSPNDLPVILWNHRWEHDKNPEEFFEQLFRLNDEGFAFKLIVLGEAYGKKPEIFELARKRLAEKIIHFGYVESFAEYARLVKSADILPVSSNQDFFGISIVEASYCGVHVLLPKRLAYPEIIDFSEFFYEENNFYDALKGLIVNLPQDRNTLAQQVSRYDWSLMSKSYLEAFKQIIV